MTVSGKEFAKKQKKAAQNYDKVVEKLDRYWNYKDYYGFYNYCDNLEIAGWSDGPFLSYHPQIEAAQIYIFVNDYIAKYLASDNIYDKNRALSDACSLLAEFYDDTKVREIHDDMCLILKTYFYINDEESENIKNMSRSQIQTVIEDSINRHDSQGDIK